MVNIKTQVKTILVLALVLTFLNINTTFSQTLISPENGATCIPTEPNLSFSSTSGDVTIEILDCSNTISGIGLSAYEHQNTFDLRATISDDLSGITYNALTNTLFAITNGGDAGSIYEAIYEVDLNGNILNTFNLIDVHESGNIYNRFYDTEDIVHLYARTFAVVEERKGKIAIIELPATSGNIHYNDANIIDVYGTWGGNNGLEGITYNPATNKLHIVRELPRDYYEIDIPTTFPHSSTTLPGPCSFQAVAGMDDAAAIHHVGLTSGFAGTDAEGNQLIVDEAGMKIIEIDANCNVIDQLQLPDEKYEGITMDNNGRIYMAQERYYIHVFTNPNPPGVLYSATVSDDNYTVPGGILDEETEYCWRIQDNNNTSAIYSFRTLGTTTICATISGGENDVEELSDGSLYDDSSDLEFAYDNNRGNQKVRLRYEDLGIPQDAIILSAYLQFTTDEFSTGVVDLTIHGEASNDALPFSNTNLSTRPNTQAAVAWSPPDWSIIGERSAKQQTPDLKTIIQEVVNRNGFDQNSALAFVISGSGIVDRRVAKSYETSPALAPQLCITFTLEECDDTFLLDSDISLSFEGPYNPTTNTMQIGSNYFNVLPTEQPYNTTPWNYNGTESIDNHTANVVDWVLVSFRKNPSADSEIFKAAGLLYQNGSIGFREQYELPGSLLNDSLYIVVDHRNHMVVMSHEAVLVQPITNTSGETYGYINYDFRQQDSYRGGSGFGQKELSNGTWASFSGDLNGDHDINGADNGIRFEQNGLHLQYLKGDMNMDADVNGSDRGILSPNMGYSSSVPK